MMTLLTYVLLTYCFIYFYTLLMLISYMYYYTCLQCGGVPQLVDTEGRSGSI